MMMPQRRIRSLFAPTAAIVGVISLTTLAGCGTPPPMHGVGVGELLPAAPLVATRADGGRWELAAEKGHFVLLYFGYTHCPDMCPATLADWARAKRALGKQAVAVHFVFVSVDPERDTPAAALAYARQFDSTFVGLAPTAAQFDAITQAWGIAAVKEPAGTDGNYGIAHPAQAFLVDREGRVKLMYPPGTKAADLASDLRQLF